jgi:hypothetical protein
MPSFCGLLKQSRRFEPEIEYAPRSGCDLPVNLFHDRILCKDCASHKPLVAIGLQLHTAYPKIGVTI